MNPHRRHLAAILFTDMPGMNPVKEANDPTTLQWRKLYHNVLIAHHEMFGGRIVNYYGTGSVSLFNCTLDAVRCARTMQREFQTLGRGKVRMGLHVGEVLDEVEDISGASVNLAARIQALGIPGSVLFSDIVYAQIRNQAEFHVIPLGKFSVTNIADKVSTYALKEKDFVVPSRMDILRYQHINVLRLLLRAPVQAILLLGRIVYGALS